jgi:hypothetical protein
MLLSNYLYTLVEKNIEKMDLIQYDQDHSMNFEMFDEFTCHNQVIKNKLQILKDFYSSTMYITCDKFIKILNQNIDEIVTDYSDYHHILVLPKRCRIYKSNFYFILYFLHMYQIKTGKKIEYIFFGMTYAIECSLFPNNEKLIIVCDDFIYSGNQIKCFTQRPKDCDIKIYFNVVGLTMEARILLEECSYHPETYIIFPKNCIQSTPSFFSTLRKMSGIDFADQSVDIDTKLIKLDHFIYNNDFLSVELLNRQVTLWSIFERIRKQITNIDKRDISLVYLFYKYPDDVSTVDSLCIFKIPKYVLDSSKINEHLSLSNEIDRMMGYGQDYNLEANDINGNSIMSTIIKKIENDIENDKPNIIKTDIIKKIETETFNSSQYNFIIKCTNPFEKKYIKDINIIQNWDTRQFYTGNTCSEKCIKPFYKQFLYINYDNSNMDKKINLLTQFEKYNEHITTLQTIPSVNTNTTPSAFVKYIKYKNKYLNLKNNIKKKLNI